MRKGLIALMGAMTMTGCVTAEDGEDVALPVCPVETRGWEAWVNAMPGPDAIPTLIVMGEALMPEKATAVLTAGPTDRMMPPGQRVTLSIEPSDRAAGWDQVRLEIKPALPEYSSVVIGCGGNTIATISPVMVAQ